MSPLARLSAPVSPHPVYLAFQLRVTALEEGVVIAFTDRDEAVRLRPDGRLEPLPASPWWRGTCSPIPGGLVALQADRAARWDGAAWSELPAPPLPRSLRAGAVCASCVADGHLRLLVHQSEEHHAAGFSVEERCTAVLDLDLASERWGQTLSLGDALPAGRLAPGPDGTLFLDGRRLLDPARLKDDIGRPDVVGRPAHLIESVHREEQALFPRPGRNERVHVSAPLPDGSHLVVRWTPGAGAPLAVTRARPGGESVVVFEHAIEGEHGKSPAFFRLGTTRFALVDAIRAHSRVVVFDALSGTVEPAVELPGDVLRGGGAVVAGGRLHLVGALVDTADGWGFLPEIHRVG